MDQIIYTEQLQDHFLNAEITDLGDDVYEIQYGSDKYIIEVLQINFDEKSLKIRCNHNIYSLIFKNELDKVLDNMGIKRGGVVGDTQVKAPMPGKIINVMVKAGDVIEEGTPLLVLEAMKMENVLKSSLSGAVENVTVTAGDNVEKGQILIEMLPN